jgi:phosphate uptake regulator
MKRKVIKQGNNTLTLTLPRDWTEKFGVKAGDELDIEEMGRQLILKNSSNAVLDKIEIDAAEMNERVLRWVLSAAHKSGYDEIEILHQSPDQLKIIHEIVKDLYMGFSIVEQTNSRCILKAISQELESEFDLILRRAFLVALSMADTCHEMLQSKDYKNLSGLIALEHSNNQLTNFCERVIVRSGIKNGKKNSFYYVITWNLEKICDFYKYLCDYFPDSKHEVKKEILAVFEKSNQLFRAYYELFYKFDVNELSRIASKCKEVLKETRQMSKHVKNESEFLLLSTVMNIILSCMDFSASYVAINQFKE